MARIISNIQFDISGVDLNWYYEYMIDSDLIKGANITYQGKTYSDYVYVEGQQGTEHYEINFGGENLVSNGNGALIGGTITGLLEYNLSNNNRVLNFVVDGISIPATSVYNAFLTKGNADEIALINSQLGGDDEFILSPFDDVANGLGGNDIMRGNGGNDTLYGGSGNDEFIGGPGNDTYYGGIGNDLFWVADDGDLVFEGAGEGTDTVKASVDYTLPANVENLEFINLASRTGTGNDLDNKITGTSYDDVLRGLAGNDIINGGNGHDMLYGGLGDDTYIIYFDTLTVIEAANEGTDTVKAYVSYTMTSNVERLDLLAGVEGRGNSIANVINANAENNILYGMGGNDIIDAGGGNDWIDGGAGIDIVTGGAGVDTIDYSSGDDGGAIIVNLGLDGPAGTEQLTSIENAVGSPFGDLILGSSGANVLEGRGGSDVMRGGGGVDQLTGGDGNDTLSGGAGADVLKGGADADVLYAYERDDPYSGDNGGNELFGDAGDDILVAWNSIASGTVDELTGGAGKDRFYVDTQQGNIDHILDFSEGDIASTMTSADPTNYFIVATDQGTKVTYKDGAGILGQFQFDTRILPADLQLFREESPFGEETLLSVRNEYSYVGHAVDQYEELRPYFAIVERQLITLAKQKFGGALTDAAKKWAVSKFWDLARTQFEDNPVFRNFVLASILKAGMETSLTGAQIEELSKKIVDKIVGTAISDFTKHVQSGITGTSSSSSAAEKVLSFVEGAGEIFSLVPVVGQGVAVLKIGKKILDGLYLAADVYLASQDADILQQIADTADGNIDPKILKLDSGTLSLIQRAEDITSELGSAGKDQIFSTVGVQSLPDAVEDATLIENLTPSGQQSGLFSLMEAMVPLNGNALDNMLTGNSQANAIAGMAGDDVLVGGGGNDSIDGGEGDDLAVYAGLIGDYVVTQDGGVFTLKDLVSGRDGTDTVTGVESFEFGGSPFAAAALAEIALVPLSGTDDGEALDGRDAETPLLISGLGGDDVLFGSNGGDLLDGGEGTDTFAGGLGDDRYIVDSQSELVFEDADGGTDSVFSSASFYLYANIERLTLLPGAGDIFGVGNELDNMLFGNEGQNLIIGWDGADEIHGGAARDALFGVEGDDLIYGDAGVDYIVAGAGNDTVDGGADADEIYGQEGDDILDGGASFDTDIIVGGTGNDIIYGNSGLGDYDLLYGNEGDDTFYVDTPADLVFEQPSEGHDTVVAGITGAGFYLYANIEDLVLTGTTPFGVGNALDNSLTGSDATNWLLGGAGNDILNGKGGNDVLFGEAGSDTFVFEPGTGGDVIGDFAPGTDRIDLSAYGFSWAQVQGAMTDGGGAMAIDLANGDFLVLNGVLSAQLHESDFVLV